MSRPTQDEVDRVVLGVLRAKGRELRFPELERDVLGESDVVTNPFDVRESAWRLIGANKARLTPEFGIRAIVTEVV